MNKLIRFLACTIAATLLCLGSPARADWRQELSSEPLPGNPSILDETNCVPLMLKAFSPGETVKTLIFMPGSTDELYFFHRVHVRLSSSAPSLADAIAALTNQTLIRLTARDPFLMLHTDEDPLQPIGVIEDAATAERIKSVRLDGSVRFDDRDWGVLQPFLAKTLKVRVLPGPNSAESHHFFRHSFAAGSLNGWELLQAVAMAGKTKFRITRDEIVFSGDPRVMATPSVPTNFLTSMFEPPSMKRVAAIPLKGVTGRLDHFAVDTKRGRLFVAALENRTIEVVDIKAGRRIQQLTGIDEPQGLAFVPNAKRLLVCSRGDGSLRSFDAGTFKEKARINLGKNADNIRVLDRMAFAGSGGEPGPGLLSGINLELLDAPRTTVAPQPVVSKIELPAHPESFQVDAKKHRVFVNVPDAHQICIVDIASPNWTLADSWQITAAEQNFPMALDQKNNRLFVACRKPARVLAYEATTGRLLFASPCAGDADDLFYDSALERLYVIGGQGAVDIFLVPRKATDAVLQARVWTKPKARTGLFIPELQLLAVAAPNSDQEPAQILLYKVAP